MERATQETDSPRLLPRVLAADDAGGRGGAAMTMLLKGILFWEQHAAILCDGNCAKAWGSNQRPRVQRSENEDDWEWLADHELGEAPREPRSWEGTDTKPRDYNDPHRQNRWCARECERNHLSPVGGGLITLRDFSQRVRNLPETTT